MITESIIHQLIGEFTLKYFKTPNKILINSEHLANLPDTLRIKFAELLTPNYFLPYNTIEAA